MQENRLLVRGTASTEVTPDAVEWSLVVHEAGSDGRETFARCSARLRALLGALEGVEVTTGPVGVSPEVTERGVPTGRQHARAALTAVAPLTDAGELAAAAIEAGADELHGPTLRTSGIEAARDALYAEAVHPARRRAQAMAEAARRPPGGGAEGARRRGADRARRVRSLGGSAARDPATAENRRRGPGRLRAGGLALLRRLVRDLLAVRDLVARARLVADEERVAAWAAVDLPAPEVRVDDVRPGTALDVVDAVAGVDEVVPGTAVQQVVLRGALA